MTRPTRTARAAAHTFAAAIVAVCATLAPAAHARAVAPDQGGIGGAAPAVASAAKASPADLKAVHDLLAALQAEKLLRLKAGMARYASAQQRAATSAKVEAVPKETVYARLAAPMARRISTDTATEMARFYQSSYGQKLVHAMYNNGPSLGSSDPKPTPREAADMKRPAWQKANAEFQAARPALEHEAFVLVTQIANGK